MSQPFHDSVASTPFALTKAQFAVVMATAIGDPFTLDRASLRELKLSRQEIAEARRELTAAQLYDEGPEAAVAPALANLLAAMLTPGWKMIIQSQAPEPTWRQFALHLGDEGTIAEGLRHDESRQLASFSELSDALNWLLDETTTNDGAGREGESEPLALLLPRAEMVNTMLMVNNATDDAQAALLWLIAEGALWLVDAQSDERARTISRAALARRLSEMVR
ncbi:MAG: hypothetical protein H6638_14355 [Ardenticatenales bacterium]|nr:hypothetical protein [Ardenticatenales bacterium]MCB9172770.1 hypothetical protein [Ardenticatenales bacterium]